MSCVEACGPFHSKHIRLDRNEIVKPEDQIWMSNDEEGERLISSSAKYHFCFLGPDNLENDISFISLIVPKEF